MAYRKALEEEAKQKEIDKQIEEQIRNGTWRQYHPQTQNENNIKTDVSSENQVKKCPFKHGVPISKDEPSVNNETNISNDQEISESRKTNQIDKTKPIENQIDIQTSDNMGGSNLPNSEDVNLVNVDQPMENGDCSQSSGETNQNAEEVNQNSVQVNQNCGETNQNGKETSQNSEVTENEVEITELSVVEKVPLNRQPVVLPGGIVMPPPRVETVSTSWKTQHLTHEQVNDYCKTLFQFKTVNIMHFK